MQEIGYVKKAGKVIIPIKVGEVKEKNFGMIADLQYINYGDKELESKIVKQILKQYFNYFFGWLLVIILILLIIIRKS